MDLNNSTCVGGKAAKQLMLSYRCLILAKLPWISFKSCIYTIMKTFTDIALIDQGLSKLKTTYSRISDYSLTIPPTCYKQSNIVICPLNPKSYPHSSVFISILASLHQKL